MSAGRHPRGAAGALGPGARRRRRSLGLLVAAGLVLTAPVLGGCLPGPGAGAPTAAAPLSSGLPSADAPTESASPSPAAESPLPEQPSVPTNAPAGTTSGPLEGTDPVTIPSAGLVLPVPEGWEIHDAAALDDPATRAGLAAGYPGMDQLLDAFGGLGERATPVLLAVDPASASGGAMATSLSVVVAQPPVRGMLLDLVAGFIETGVSGALGTDAEVERSRASLAVGDAVRLRFPADADDGVEAVAWIVGAPAATVLVAAVGTPAALDALGPDTVVAAIQAADGAVP